MALHYGFLFFCYLLSHLISHYRTIFSHSVLLHLICESVDVDLRLGAICDGWDVQFAVGELLEGLEILFRVGCWAGGAEWDGRTGAGREELGLLWLEGMFLFQLGSGGGGL